jgi:hypothetical protein
MEKEFFFVHSSFVDASRRGDYFFENKVPVPDGVTDPVDSHDGSGKGTCYRMQFFTYKGRLYQFEGVERSSE